MPTEPNVTGYVVLAIGIVCYIALALIWHYAFCQSLENEDEAERRTQFCRALQDKVDRDKIEEWKQFREASKRSTWNNVTEPAFQMKFDKAKLDKAIEAANEATARLVEQGLYGDPMSRCHIYGMRHLMGGTMFPHVLPAPVNSLMPGEYRNPFHFLDEFDQWFEFQSRKRFYREKTQDIIQDMLKNDIERAHKAYDASRCGLKFDVMCNFGVQILDPRSVLIRPDFT